MMNLGTDVKTMYRFMFSILTPAMILLSQICAAQQADRDAPTAKVDWATTLELIRVAITIRTADTQLFIPVCGKHMADEVLCYGSATAMVEVETRKGWTLMKSIPNMVDGYLSPADVVNRLIPPRTQARFTLEFSKRSYSIEQGQRARLVIMAWPDRETMVNNWQQTDRALRLVTSTFQLP